MTFLSKLLNIDSLDLEYIEEYFEFLGEDDQNSVCGHLQETFAETPFKGVDANTFIYAIFDCINDAVFTEIKEKIEDEEGNQELLKICQSRIDEFSPWLNCIDSAFNNELDKVDVRARTFREIVEDVLELLRNDL
jgi:hypothetical protein